MQAELTLWSLRECLLIFVSMDEALVYGIILICENWTYCIFYMVKIL